MSSPVDEKLNAFVTIAQGKSEIHMDTLREELKITEDEIEEVIVQAINCGLVDASIDDINKLVTIRSAAPTRFDIEHFKNLKTRIGILRENLLALSQVCANKTA